MLKTSGFGRLTQDPKIIEIGSSAKTYFTLVWNENRKNSSGEVIQNPHYIDCEMWDSAADYFFQNFRKGDKVYIEGLTKQERWEKDGQQKSKIVIRVTQFEKVSERNS